MKRKKIIFSLLLLYAVGCSTQPEPEFAVPVGDETHSQPYVSATQTMIVEESAAPEMTLTPTEDTRLTPDDWQEWPIIPEVTETAREIYRKGIVMGNNPQAFSKVGDCQNVKQSFLGFFDHPGKYEGLTGIDDLQDTIKETQKGGASGPLIAAIEHSRNVF